MNHYTILPTTLQRLKPLSNKKYIYTLYEDKKKFIKVIPNTEYDKNKTECIKVLAKKN